MCHAIRRLREQSGISNNELSKLLGVAQSTAWRFETNREPGFAECQLIERVLNLPLGALFVAAGYAPTVDVTVAVELDPDLRAGQKKRIIAVIERARSQHRSQPVDTITPAGQGISNNERDNFAEAYNPS
jgi:transcriptional regulator with XRE-family HTH domain